MKTKSLCVLVFRPSRRRTSSYACSLLQTMDKNGTPAAKCRASTKTVIKAQMPARIIKRCRPSQCTAELYQKMSKPRKHMLATRVICGLYAAKHECRMSKEWLRMNQVILD